MLSLYDILSVFGQREKLKLLPAKSFSGISIDSRTIKKGEIFVAIKGSSFDGHSFLDEAFEKGAIAAVVTREKKDEVLSKGKPYVLIDVDDTHQALKKIACVYRKNFKGKVIAVTGSNGKTTTKEIIAHLLSPDFEVLKTFSTQNNEIGVPLTIFGLKSNHQIIVFELGASKKRDIFSLKEITRPHFGVITNIGQTHLEFLKTAENVLAAKLELFAKGTHMVKTAILNFSDENLKRAAGCLKCKIVWFGEEKDCRYRADDIFLEKGRVAFTVNGRYRVRLNTIGEHNIYNALAAWTVASQLGLEPAVIRERLETFVFPPHRLQLSRIRDVFVIEDAYNANPQSVKGALKALSSLKEARSRISCLADMCELGELSQQLHYEIGLEAGRLGIDTVVAVGSFSEFIVKGAQKGGVRNCISKKDKTGMLEWLLNNVKPKQAVLFKGSRAMKMEELAKCFINSYTT